MSAARDATATALRRWFASHLGVDDVVVEDLVQHTEGFSWQTWTLSVRVEGEPPRGFAVRREPEDGLLAPYDTRQQYRVHEAVLAHAAVPMPGLVAIETDPSHLGMPFYVMDRVEGHVPVQWRPDDPVAFPDEDARRELGLEFVDVLAAIHAIDHTAAGLAELGDPASSDEAARQQLARWERYASEAQLVPLPALWRAVAWLHGNVATSGRVSLVHGDYRIGNVMIDADRHVNAVFDWELVHVSDPVEDVAYLGLPLFRGRSPLFSHLLPEHEVLARYRERTGLEIEPAVLRWWMVLGMVKAAASHLRAARAFEDGANGDLRLAAMGHQVLHVLRSLDRLVPRGW